MHGFADEIGRAFAYALIAVVTVIWGYASGLFHKKPIPAITLEESSAKAKQQEGILHQLRAELCAMRAYISKYHNGDYFVDNSSILRQSRIVEVVAHGVSFVNERMRGILVSAYHEESDLVQLEGSAFFITDELPLSPFRQMCEETGVESGARCALWKWNPETKKRDIIGFVGVDFSHTAKPENIEKLCEYAKWVEREL